MSSSPSLQTEVGADRPVLAHISTQVVYRPEENPYEMIMVDITHRCNMHCANCYVPNRDIPDMDIDWLCGILARLPRRTHIRLVGAEPTVRKDLPEIIQRVRKLRHIPMILTNGLTLADRNYVRTLKKAGLRSVYLSLNGGFEDDIYEVIDELRCAGKKTQALENLCDENMYVSLGMILIRNLNEQLPRTVLDYARRRRQVREYHLRSMGRFGRYMNSEPFTLEELIKIFANNASIDEARIVAERRHQHFVDFTLGGLRVQLTQWPDLGSTRRGRLAPDGTLQPFFEHIIANEGGY